MSFMKHFLAAIRSLGITLAADITGARATFPYPIYANLVEAYYKIRSELRVGHRLNTSSYHTA